MRLRRLTSVFWAACLVACGFMVYVMSGMFGLPSIKPEFKNVGEGQWSSMELKLKNIESALEEHQALVGEIKTAVEQFIDTPKEDSGKPAKDQIPIPGDQNSLQETEYKDEHDESRYEIDNKRDAEMRKQMEISNGNWLDNKGEIVGKVPYEQSCGIVKQGVPKSDVQMLSMYERLDFTDKDGGVWKQGWKVEYDEAQWNSKKKLKIFVVPHSHNDPGWLKTFEKYYATQTKSIFSNMMEKLQIDNRRKFIWAEISFLSLWWTQDATDTEKALFLKFVKEGQIEIVTGGWVMNDEANSHWLSVVQQLTAGHQWALQNLGIVPKNNWAIDPFGHSSSQPYLLKLAGFENSVIQRVHYRVKKELALNRQLEFNWRQLWDGSGKTDTFTHMMPFYSYDIPHTCGPDPAICCQFDFKRLPGFGVSCPWGTAPKKITDRNVEEKSFTILDQWRKKAQLYRSDVVLVPLGDDFRWDRSTEWDQQMENYEKIFDYINSRDEWHAEAQFGTLEDYFAALHKETKREDFPVMSGDFFTYADRNQHYWSGYYTSRPFYKNMDRVLLSYLRAAETLTAQVCASGEITEIVGVTLRDRVESARRHLALFQHHDGVTGTSRDDVRADYAHKLLAAIKFCQSAIQQAAYYLLGGPKIINQVADDAYMRVDEVWSAHDQLPGRLSVVLDSAAPSSKLVLHNPLAHARTDLVSVLVNTPFVQVYNSSGDPVPCQVSPLVAGELRMDFAANKYQVWFVATLPPLSLLTYTLVFRDQQFTSPHTKFATVRLYNAEHWDNYLPKLFNVDQKTGRLEEEITMKVASDASTRVVLTSNGLLKAVVAKDSTVTPLHMDFVSYGSRKEQDNNSGAYLFIPDGPGKPVDFEPYPEIVVVEGPLTSIAYTSLSSSKVANIVHTITLHANPSLPDAQVEVANIFSVSEQASDVELAMRLRTSVNNGRHFYTDLNGMQMIKRATYSKLPLQANWYPLASATYIQDEWLRLSVLTSTPLGMAALEPGQIEVMQDRRLNRDDNRGLSQGILDNVRTRHTFRILLEKANENCQQKVPEENASGQLSVAAHVSSQTLLHPVLVLHYVAGTDHSPEYVPLRTRGAADLVLASYRTHLTGRSKGGGTVAGSGLVLQRVYLDLCYGDQTVQEWYPLSDGKVRPLDFLGRIGGDTKFFESSLTFVEIGDPLPADEFKLCPMEIKAIFVNQTHTEKRIVHVLK